MVFHKRWGRSTRKTLASLIMVSAGMSLTSLASAEKDVQQALDTKAGTNKAAERSQQRIDKIADQTDNIVSDYRSVLRQIENAKVYGRQLQKVIDSQEEERTSLNTQIEEINETQNAVMPMMERMIDTLGQFVNFDVPFLVDDRLSRVDLLKSTMERSDVTVSEKYRRILEAYQIENEFGTTIESYRGTLELSGGSTREVDFLRVGRIGLYYQTLDQSEVGVYDATSGSWRSLDESYIRPINRAIKVALRQATPEIFELAVPASQGVN